MQDVLNLSVRKVSLFDSKALDSITAAREHLDQLSETLCSSGQVEAFHLMGRGLNDANLRVEESLRPALQGLSDLHRRMEGTLRPLNQRLNDANLRMEESLRPALQGLSDLHHSLSPLAERMNSCFGQVDWGANLRASLLRTSAPPFDVEAHRPKGGSRPSWLRGMIRGLIRRFIRLQSENSGRKLLKADFEQYLFAAFPISYRAIDEIWSRVGGEWKSGGRPAQKALAEKIAQPELDAFFSDFRRELASEIDN